MRVRLFGLGWHLPLMLLWVAESLAVFAACRIAAAIVGHAVAGPAMLWLQVAVFGVSVMLVMVAMGLFSRRLRDRMAGIVLRITVGVSVGGLLTGLLLGLSPADRMSPKYLMAAIAVAWLLVILVRTVARGLIDQDVFKQRILVIGAGVNAARILDLRRREDQRGFKVAGFVPIPDETIRIRADRVIKETGSLAEIAAIHEIEEIVVAMDERRGQFPLKELLQCRLAGLNVTELITFLERETGKVYLTMLSPSWMIFGGGFRRSAMRLFSERSFDLIASLILLVLAFPFILLVALAIKLEDGLRAPMFYSQPRVGQGGRVFKVRKFRSMRVDAEKDGQARWAVTNDKRITRVGSIIRKARLDELPQLLNVFRGDMSFVGPRPERPEFVQHLADTIPYYSERHSVKPGITGWAQLCYPYGASEQDALEKLQYDLYYVKHHSLVFDLLILLQTAEVILFGKGAR